MVTSVLLALCAQGCATSPQSESGSALYLAASRNQVEVAKGLIARGANPNAKCEFGLTPLHAAARKRHPEMAKLLLDHGAHVGGLARAKPAYLSSVVSPLDWAVSEVAAPGPVTDLLVEAGARPRDLGKIRHLGNEPEIASFKAGAHWAVASYAERKAERNRAIENYLEAAYWYGDASKVIANDLKLGDFFATVFGRELLVGLAGAVVAAQGGNPFAAEMQYRAQLERAPTDERERSRYMGRTFATLAKFCSERAEALKKPE